jgi:hypothetical protein
MPDNSNRRVFSRVPVKFAIEILSVQKSIHSTETLNVSMNGLFVKTSERLPVGSECRVILYLDEPGGEVRIEAKARVVRASADGLAVEFQETELESYQHLRNLVMMNSADVAQTEKELDDHIGLKRQR